ETHRLLTAGIAQHLAARATALRAIRSFFDARAFLEVETPSLVPSPGLDLHLDAFTVEDAGYLITSPEYQMKRLLAGGIPLSHHSPQSFRKGQRAHRHNPEFLMLEWYRTFATEGDLINETEALVRHVALALTGDLTLHIAQTTIDLRPPFERLSVADAFAR